MVDRKGKNGVRMRVGVLSLKWVALLGAAALMS